MKRLWTTLAALLVSVGPVLVGAGCSDSDSNPPDYDECFDGWMRIPAGPFQFGMNPDDPTGGIDCGDLDRESPRYTVTLSEFCMQQTEVSVASYRACVEAGVCTAPLTTIDNGGCNFTPEPGEREDHPINCVSWSQAREYCQQWEGGDLPSEAQWEKAARGTDLRVFPWGNEPVTCERANYDVNGVYRPEKDEGAGAGCSSSTPFTWPVGHLKSTKGDSPFGVKDMAGNVGEWTLDCYEGAFYAECVDGHCVDPVNLCGDPNNKTIRGGSGGSNIEDGYRAFCLFKRSFATGEPSSGGGFRCVRSPERQATPSSNL